MNHLYITRHHNESYWVVDSQILPALTGIIDNKGKDDNYKLFRFYNKSDSEKKLFYQAFRKFYNKKPAASKGQSIMWLVDSPRMSHLIVHEIVEAEMRGYNNVIVMGEKNVGPSFFNATKLDVFIEQLNSFVKAHDVKALITPCLNKVHNQILPKLNVKKIGIQHGFGCWVENKLLDPVEKHFNFGAISNRDFHNPKSITAGYSPTKLFDLYPEADDKYILYLSQGKAYTNKKNIIGDLKLLDLEIDFDLPVIIKEHHDAEGEFKGGLQALVYSETETNTVEMIRKATIVITSWSGAGIEALFFNKPTIILDTQNDGGKFYKGSRLVVPMEYPKLKERVAFYLDGGSWHNHRFMEAINYNSGKEASKIIIDSI